MVVRRAKKPRKVKSKSDFKLDYETGVEPSQFGKDLYGFTFNIEINHEAFDQRIMDELNTEDVDYIDITNQKMLGDGKL